jgi:hypothetical protein
MQATGDSLPCRGQASANAALPWCALEEMGDLARKMLESRKARGLPCIDPFTGELVKGSLRLSQEPSPGL